MRESGIEWQSLSSASLGMFIIIYVFTRPPIVTM